MWTPCLIADYISLAASKLRNRTFSANACREGRRESYMPWRIYTSTCYPRSRPGCWSIGRLPCSCWQTQHYNNIWRGCGGLLFFCSLEFDHNIHLLLPVLIFHSYLKRLEFVGSNVDGLNRIYWSNQISTGTDGQIKSCRTKCTPKIGWLLQYGKGTSLPPHFTQS